MSSSFQIEVNHMSTYSVVQISGPIDETAVFPELRSEGRINVDLSQVTRINSVGIRSWCLWIQRFRSPADIVLIGCPVFMVTNFTAIKGFLSRRCRVFSFEIPFYSEET